MWNVIAVILLVSSLSGCLMGPDYKRPDTPQSDSWRLPSGASGSIANLPWWELLKDEALQQLIRTALEENLDLQMAAANIDEYQAQLTIAQYDLIPSLSASGTAFGFRNTNGNVLSIPGGGAVPISQRDGTTLSQLSGDVGLKWEVDLWGRIRRSVEASRAQLLSKQENQRAVVLSLVGNVAESYLDLRALDLQIDITTRTFKAWDDSVRLSKLRYQKGDIPKLDLDRFVAERAGTAAQLADLERQVVQRENQISVLLGHKPMAVSRGRLLTEQPMPPEIPPGLPSELLQRRPDIVQAEQELVAATANIGVAQAMRFPQLALTGQAGGTQLNISDMSFNPYATFMGAAALTAPLYNASALGYQVKVSEAKGNQAIARYRKTILQAFQEVEDALVSVQKTKEQQEAQEQQVQALESSLHLAELRYQGGRASYLDLLTAKRTLFDAELALAKTRRNQLVSMVKLYKALGGGWSPKNAKEQRAASTAQEAG
ncbi:MAG: efflux transporter outer membrane subunit [Nitrospira sp.]|nr:efflux transporter outer membrane subunit [Nitrospira sp.]MBH0182897.1 efflux transporter outer membrane subunit [Nitrospira sp.]MBH0186216.1 efflux transporter outer membrane subunit [Nitrospira sp.]